MINLIPNEEKKATAKDFYFRLLALVFFMLGISILIASITVLPSYFVSFSKENLINIKLKTQEQERSLLPNQDVSSIITDLKNKLNLIENTKKNQFLISQRVINEIILKKTPKIKIIEISYQNNQESGKKIDISGIAPSREVLLLFRKALEDDTAFSKVDLPISNFIKGSDIKFYLSLIPS